MSKVRILHLSDLHLSYNDSVEYDTFMSSLEKSISSLDSIHMIAITGDAINKGNVDDFETFYGDFIKKISKYAGCKEKNIFLVPGNHDAQRDDLILQLRNEYEKDTSKGCNFQIPKNQIKKVLTRFDDFNEINKKIHDDERDIESFGVYVRHFERCNISIICINSSIYSHDDNDYKKLGISKFQLDLLTQKYKQIKSQYDINLSIALMHHPDDWLRPDEQKELWNYFSSVDKLPIDIILHGHTHEGKIGGKIDLDTFTLSLVTGTTFELGNKFNLNNAFNSCRFAFYEIDMDENFINGKLFIQNNVGEFVPDRSNYRSVKNDGSFCIPFRQDEINFSAIKIPVPIDNRIKLNDEYITLLDEMVEKMWTFEKACRRQLDTFSTVPKPRNDIQKMDIIRDWFMNIASCAKNCLFEQKEFQNVRVHFRVYDGNSHIHFCATKGEKNITPIKWNNGKNLIFHAFDSKRSLVKSLNPDLYFDTKGEWKDFLTVPVLCEKYNGLEIPMFGFGISVKGTDNVHLSMKLELLSFLRIELLVDNIISSFYRCFLA